MFISEIIRSFDSNCVGFSIKDFMTYWRTNWPEESVTPKMHIMVLFIKKWKLGCRFYGEQGAEGIHREFSTIAANHTRNNDPVMRLKSMLKRHYINTFSKAQNKPRIKSRGPYKQKNIVA